MQDFYETIKEVSVELAVGKVQTSVRQPLNYQDLPSFPKELSWGGMEPVRNDKPSNQWTDRKACAQLVDRHPIFVPANAFIRNRTSTSSVHCDMDSGSVPSMRFSSKW
jgi:hypothetical protein